MNSIPLKGGGFKPEFVFDETRNNPRADRLLGLLVTTPRLHGIHHSAVEAHRHANLSSGLTLWDALHGTLRRDVAQDAIRIGLPAGNPTL